MKKVLLIVQREYATRVKKKTFLLITFIAPLLFALLMVGPAFLAQMSGSKDTVYVVDKSGAFHKDLKDREGVQFQFVDKSVAKAQEVLLADNPDAYILAIPEDPAANPEEFRLVGKKSPSMGLSNNLEDILEAKVRKLRIKNAGLSRDKLASIETDISLSSIVLSESGKKSKGSTALASSISMIGGFAIYFFIFMYGGQVTSGVHEEKTSRIVEVLASSVRPIQLMFGKIIGIALVGLTQFLLWIILTAILSGVLMLLMGPESLMAASGSSAPVGGSAPAQDSAFMQALSSALGGVNLPMVIFAFLFFFLFGYFTYSSMFAAVAAAVDNQTDMRQFMFPLSIPLLLAIAITPTVILNNPSSTLAVVGSMIPFTAPVIMMARIPFGVPPIELISSFVLMILGFLVCVWLAAKVYRTGILMYGKKVTPRELFKWIATN
jgi:ABC-2 type transport system permease protein